MPTVSVIVATYNRASLLDQCLHHLARQTFSGGDEVLISDNGSTDHTAAVVARRAPTFPAPLSRIVEPRPGKSHAVASALSVASGDIIAFTDDDVNVSPGWMSALRSALIDDDVALAGGPVDPRWERTAPAWLQLAGHSRLGAPLGLLDYGGLAAPLGDRTLLGANMAVWRSVLRQLGGYSPRLGKLRGTLLSGDDHELCHRIQAAGFRARYIPSARVAHWVPARRMRLRYFIGWFYWSGISHAVMEKQRAAAPHMFRMRMYYLRRFIGAGGGAAALAVAGRLPAAVDRLMDSAFAAGYVAGRGGLAHTGPVALPQAARSL
jgi:glycosyltransferase involved in cell wall biosynthesis